jgi:hypothetical protein
MPVSGDHDPDPKNPAKTDEPEKISAGVDVNEATLSEENTLSGEKALAETHERHREMAEVDEAERS